MKMSGLPPAVKLCLLVFVFAVFGGTAWATGGVDKGFFITPVFSYSPETGPTGGLTALIGVPLGVSSALKHNSWLDQIIRILNAIFLAAPEFLLGVLVVLVGVLYFNWRPPIEVAYLWDRPLLNLQVTLGPAIALGAGSAAYMARMTRSTVLEVMNEDYVRTARAKGLHARLVIWRHVFRNAIVPVITMSGLTLVGLMGSSVAVEMAFATPGLGYTLVKAMGDRDFMVIQNLVLLYGVVCVVANLIVDMACGWLDPRIVYD